MQERNAHLCKLINVHPLSFLPHPEWTLQHDAVLLRAVVKHGWLDSHATCLAVGNDKSIRWGAPFEISDQSVREDMTQTESAHETDKKSEDQYQYLYNTATRAVTFLQQLDETFVDVMPAPVLNEVSLLATYDAFSQLYAYPDSLLNTRFVSARLIRFV